MNYTFMEELSLNHWPSLSTLLYDGWLLRFANGYTKRSNSISPIYGSTYDLDHKIDECERMYIEHQLRPTFKITPFVQPANLDYILAEKGYSVVDLTSVQTKSLVYIQEPALHSVKICTELQNEWLEDFCRLSSTEKNLQPTITRMLTNIKTKMGYISLYEGGKVVACGFGVIERAYIGLYDIVTDEHYRNRGFAEQLIWHLLQWGKQNGAEHSYLAVVANNEPARRLYSKIGYSEVYTYWYRVKCG